MRTMAGAAWPGAAEPAIPPLHPEGLYVHFPFCVSLCPYCDFVVLAGRASRGPGSRIAALLEAVERELELRAAEFSGRTGRRVPLHSIYLGGGTPSLMSAPQVGGLLDRVAALVGISAGAEITLEANPGPDERGDLEGFRSAGVNRLSIGAQSLDDAELQTLGRRHRARDVREAFAAARCAGFDSISLDLLIDVPGQTLGSWETTLSSALALGPDHLSVYALSLDDPDAEGLTGPEGDHLPVRPGARRWRARAVSAQSDDQAAGMDAITDELSGAAGLRRYEIANLARPGRESRHNLLYWRRRPYLALGPGAHASDGVSVRSWNAARLDPYIAALAAGRLPPGGAETLDPVTAESERAILGLRLADGIPATMASTPTLRAGLAWARAHGLVEDVGERVRLSGRGRLLSNEVFMRLLPEVSSAPAVPAVSPPAVPAVAVAATSGISP